MYCVTLHSWKLFDQVLASIEVNRLVNRLINSVRELNRICPRRNHNIAVLLDGFENGRSCRKCDCRGGTRRQVHLCLFAGGYAATPSSQQHDVMNHGRSWAVVVAIERRVEIGAVRPCVCCSCVLITTLMRAGSHTLVHAELSTKYDDTGIDLHLPFGSRRLAESPLSHSEGGRRQTRLHLRSSFLYLSLLWRNCLPRFPMSTTWRRWQMRRLHSRE